jgi:hypothetical protein
MRKTRVSPNEIVTIGDSSISPTADPPERSVDGSATPDTPAAFRI